MCVLSDQLAGDFLSPVARSLAVSFAPFRIRVPTAEINRPSLAIFAAAADDQTNELTKGAGHKTKPLFLDAAMERNLSQLSSVQRVFALFKTCCWLLSLFELVGFGKVYFLVRYAQGRPIATGTNNGVSGRHSHT